MGTDATYHEQGRAGIDGEQKNDSMLGLPLKGIEYSIPYIDRGSWPSGVIPTIQDQLLQLWDNQDKLVGSGIERVTSRFTS
jgi:hypothetical protein